MDVVTQLLGGVEAAPITALVREGGEALERVREALEVLGELDPQLLARVALDAVVLRACRPSGRRVTEPDE